jgi:hypothetical protein
MKKPEFLTYLDSLINAQAHRSFELWLTSDQIKQYQLFARYCSKCGIYTDTVNMFSYRGHRIRSSSKRAKRAGEAA